MIQRIFTLLTALVLVVSCSEETPLSLAPTFFSEQELSACESVACPEISLSYLKATGPDDLSEVINDSIEQYLIRVLHIGDPEAPITATTVTEAAQHFLDTYRMHLAEYPDLPAAYSIEVEITERFRNEALLSLEQRQYTYTGGAHGYGSTHYMLFDLNTATAVTLRDLISDWEGFRGYAERSFRRTHEIPEYGSINANGFWFEDDQFYLPEAIGLTEEGVQIIYNAYEIASYADGAISLELPWSEVEPFLTDSL